MSLQSRRFTIRFAAVASVVAIASGAAASAASAATHHASSASTRSVLTQSQHSGGSLTRTGKLPQHALRSDAVAAYTPVAGTAVSGGGRWPNAAIGYFWSNGTQWVWAGYFTTSNSAGNYTLNIPTGYRVYLLAEQTIGPNYSFNEYWGQSVAFNTTGTKVNAQITMDAVQHFGS
jgi:hypothetical protein